MASMPHQLGSYTIDREIGRGGMGIVYLGRDTRLDRAVAIKSLPEHFASDPDRLARFEREARTLASLSHPNVAGIFGVEEHEGAKFLILEYVEGETLADRLDRGPLPVDESLEIASQIAAGVEAAHEQGVIHRDLKPGNVIVTPEGNAKVLDFGLARVEEASSSSVGAMSESPTQTTPAIQHSPTIPGAILGTAAYMSPEQARGRRVDKRTDIWSFGVLLYEMLVGASPFHGETVSDSIGAVLHKEVDLDRLPAETPAMVRHVLRRCLERDKSKRYRDIGDVRIEIERAVVSPESVDFAGPESRRGVHPLLSLIMAIVFLAIGAGSVMLLTTSDTPPSPPVIRATILLPDDAIVIFTGDLAGPSVISRDGSRIAFSAKRTSERQQLYIRELDSSDAEPIRGTEGAIFPFWSWDGSKVGYFSEGELRSYDLSTRTNRTVCAAQGGRGGAWLADDTIVFSPGFQSPIHRVPASGGESTPITTIDPSRHTSHRWPSATPDGDGFIYIAVSHDAGRLDESAIFLATLGEEPDIEITRAQYGATIVGDQLLLVRDSILFATPMNLVTGELTGEAKPIVSGVASDISTWNASFSAAASGALIFHEASSDLLADRLQGDSSGYGESRRTKLMRRDGRVSNILADGVPQETVSLSPDFEYLAISGFPNGQSGRTSYDIWLYRLPKLSIEFTNEENVSGESSAENQSRLREPPRRLTFLDGAEVHPQWSPDSKWIVFGSMSLERTTVPGLYKVRASGGQPELILESPGKEGAMLRPTDWSSDGRYIIYTKGSWIGIGVNDIYALDLQTNKTFPLVTDDDDQEGGMISPDGKWLAYETFQDGQLEVYVIPFLPGWEAEREQGLPTPSDQSRWRITIAGGGRPRWNPSGGELFYISSSNSMIAVEVGVDGVQFTSGVGTALFGVTIESGVDFDVSAQSEYFAISSAIDETKTSISLLTNWRQLLNTK